MTAKHTELVARILGGDHPAQAVATVYKITLDAAKKRLFRLLRHREIYSALEASPVQTAQHTRKLMRGVYISDARPAADTTSIDARLRALLYAAGRFTPSEWKALATDIRRSKWLEGPSRRFPLKATEADSDYRILAEALCEMEIADNKAVPSANHPQWLIPEDLKNESDRKDERGEAARQEDEPYLPNPRVRTADGDAYQAYVAACHKARPTRSPERWRQWAAAGRPAMPV